MNPKKLTLSQLITIAFILIIISVVLSFACYSLTYYLEHSNNESLTDISDRSENEWKLWDFRTYGSIIALICIFLYSKIKAKYIKGNKSRYDEFVADLPLFDSLDAQQLIDIKNLIEVKVEHGQIIVFISTKEGKIELYWRDRYRDLKLSEFVKLEIIKNPDEFNLILREGFEKYHKMESWK